jgi:hypothetical protein
MDEYSTKSSNIKSKNKKKNKNKSINIVQYILIFVLFILLNSQKLIILINSYDIIYSVSLFIRALIFIIIIYYFR